MRKLLLVLALLALPAAAHADQVIKAYAGVNGIWIDDQARPSDFEAGGNLRTSLSPHISLVGGAYYGFGHSYLRGSVGARITATDVDDPNFSVGVGLQYHASSEPAVRSEGWAPDVTIGWRPQPVQWPAVVLIAQGSYMSSQNEAVLIAGVRYDLGVGR